MSFSNITRRTAASIAGAWLIALGGSALAANPPAASSAPTKEMREKMATLHEQMAACLRSDKSVTECRTEMRQQCQSMMGNQGCMRMMGSGGMMGMGGGRMSGGRMGMGGGMRGPMNSSPPASSSPPQ